MIPYWSPSPAGGRMKTAAAPALPDSMSIWLSRSIPGCYLNWSPVSIDVRRSDRLATESSPSCRTNQRLDRVGHLCNVLGGFRHTGDAPSHTRLCQPFFGLLVSTDSLPQSHHHLCGAQYGPDDPVWIGWRYAVQHWETGSAVNFVDSLIPAVGEESREHT